MYVIFFWQSNTFWNLFSIDSTGWDIARLADCIKSGRPKETTEGDENEDARLEKYFQNPKLGYIDKPATVVDIHGCIVLWYLPNILGLKHTVRNLGAKFCLAA